MDRMALSTFCCTGSCSFLPSAGRPEVLAPLASDAAAAAAARSLARRPPSGQHRGPRGPATRIGGGRAAAPPRAPAATPAAAGRARPIARAHMGKEEEANSCEPALARGSAPRRRAGGCATKTPPAAAGLLLAVPACNIVLTFVGRRRAFPWSVVCTCARRCECVCVGGGNLGFSRRRRLYRGRRRRVTAVEHGRAMDNGGCGLCTGRARVASSGGRRGGGSKFVCAEKGVLALS